MLQLQIYACHRVTKPLSTCSRPHTAPTQPPGSRYAAALSSIAASTQPSCSPHAAMIKIIFYVDIAFFYRKANILSILPIYYGNKGLCHGRCRLIDWDGNMQQAAYAALQHCSSMTESYYLIFFCNSGIDDYSDTRTSHQLSWYSVLTRRLKF